jgi:alpha-mannosidase
VDPESLDAWQDQGRQERIFWLVGRPGSYTDLHLDQLANELQTPAEYVTDSRHGGTEAWEKSFLDVAPNTMSVLAIKQAEDSSGALILRLQERSGKQTVAHVESTMLQLSNDVPFKPWELKTLRIESSKHAKAKLREVSTLET